MTELASNPQPSLPDASSGLLPLEPSVGMVSYRVADIQRSLGFYVGMLGMTERARFPGLGPDERELVLGFPNTRGALVMLMWNVSRPRPYQIGEGYSRFTIMVRNADAAMKYLVEHGAPVILPVSEANNCRYGVVVDPDGYKIELLQLLRT